MSNGTQEADSICFCQRQYVSPIPCDDKLSESPCDECHKVSMLDEEISKARAHLLDLVNQRQAQCTLVNERHDVFERRLPVELWPRIFEHALEPGDPDRLPGQPWPVGRMTSFLLIRVCKAWKEVCVATPQLWTSLEIHVHDEDAPRAAVGGEVVRRVLSRSGTRPLALWVHMRPARQQLSDRIKDTLNSICSQSGRLKELYMYGPEDFFDYVFCNVSSRSQSTPILHLNPTSPRTAIFLDNSHLAMKPSNPMRPTALHLHHLSPWHRFYDTDNITEASFHDLGSTSPSESYLAISKRAPLLEKLTIRGYAAAEYPPLIPNMVLPNLRILDIAVHNSYSHIVSLRPFFDPLTLPSLTTLSISAPVSRVLRSRTGRGQLEKIDIQSLTDLLERSKPLVLTRLVLVGCGATLRSSDPVSFFRFRDMHDLRELVIEDGIIDGGFVSDMFAGFDRYPEVLARLTALTLVGCIGFIDETHLLNFILPERRPFLELLDVAGELPQALIAYIRDNNPPGTIRNSDARKYGTRQYWVGQLEIRVNSLF